MRFNQRRWVHYAYYLKLCFHQRPGRRVTSGAQCHRLSKTVGQCIMILLPSRKWNPFCQWAFDQLWRRCSTATASNGLQGLWNKEIASKKKITGSQASKKKKNHRNFPRSSDHLLYKRKRVKEKKRKQRKAGQEKDRRNIDRSRSTMCALS